MFVVFLEFAQRRGQAGALMQAHNDWVRRGLNEGVFLLVGSLSDGTGGAILVHGVDEAALRERVASDPFVAEGVVTARIVAIAPNRADPRLAFLLPAAEAGVRP